MLVVVPIEERPAERSGVVDRVEPVGELGPILQGLELGFAVGVVGRGVGAAVCLQDAHRIGVVLLMLWSFCRSGCGWWPRRARCVMSSWRCLGGGRKVARPRLSAG